MTSEIKYNLDLLESFRTTASKQASEFGTLGDAANPHLDGSMFGKTGGAQLLATAVQATEQRNLSELRRAEALLQSVSRSIDKTSEAIEEADRSGSLQLSSTGGGSSGGGSGSSSSSGSSSGSGSSGSGSSTPPAATRTGTAPPVQPGTGVKINLPGGKTVEAPNEQAAEAVRAAIGQLGVPYVFGAESPGKAFDCSGLTKYAYEKAGIDLPHFAASQDVGERVSEANLAPGDLCVWDGHVTMYVGDGQVIEAPHTGESVHIVPLYTHNGSDTFEGFFRPTAH